MHISWRPNEFPLASGTIITVYRSARASLRIILENRASSTATIRLERSATETTHGALTRWGTELRLVSLPGNEKRKDRGRGAKREKPEEEAEMADTEESVRLNIG